MEQYKPKYTNQHLIHDLLVIAKFVVAFFIKEDWSWLEELLLLLILPFRIIEIFLSHPRIIAIIKFTLEALADIFTDIILTPVVISLVIIDITEESLKQNKNNNTNMTSKEIFVQLVTKRNSWRIMKVSILVSIELAINLVMCARKILLAAILLMEEAHNNADHITTAIELELFFGKKTSELMVKHNDWKLPQQPLNFEYKLEKILDGKITLKPQ